jgi:hypothetical protein
VRPVRVVVLDVAVEDPREMARADDQQMIETLPADGADPTLCEGVRIRCPHRRADHPDGAPHVVEGSGELAVTIADEVPNYPPGFVKVGGEGAGLLGRPSPLGLVVMPHRCTRRDSISMKNKT